MVKITSRGRITIPKTIRDHLQVGEGDRIDIQVDENGEVRMVASSLPIRELVGILHRPGRSPVSIEEMDASIIELLGS